MDHLRSDVTLRAVGQRDPLTEFKHEAFALFDELSRNLRTEIARSIFRFEIMRRLSNPSAAPDECRLPYGKKSLPVR